MNSRNKRKVAYRENHSYLPTLRMLFNGSRFGDYTDKEDNHKSNNNNAIRNSRLLNICPRYSRINTKKYACNRQKIHRAGISQ